MLEAVDGLELATNVKLLGNAEEVLDARVGVVVAAEDVLGLVDLVGAVDVLDGQNGQVGVVARVAEGQSGAGLDAKGVNLLLVDVESNGHAEKQTIGKTVILDDAIVVLLVHEACVQYDVSRCPSFNARD